MSTITHVACLFASPPPGINACFGFGNSRAAMEAQVRFPILNADRGWDEARQQLKAIFPPPSQTMKSMNIPGGRG